MSDDPDYRLHAATFYAEMREGRRATMGYQFDLGKWLMASLVLVNGGALVGLADRAPATIVASAPFFIAGITAALLCGFITWVNAGFISSVYENLSQPASLTNREAYPDDVGPWKVWAVIVTFWASIALGLGSLGGFVGGANAALSTLSQPQSQPMKSIGAMNKKKTFDRLQNEAGAISV